MNRLFKLVVFLGGLALVAWVAAGYVGTHTLAFCVTGLIAAIYLAGAVELYRGQQLSRTLADALATLQHTPSDLGAWLATLHPALRGPVRGRLEGGPVVVPGPALTPYLVGLLVLVGMLGTFLGMVVTLRGTGAALESATDLQAIRVSLAAPVKGLGFAFGTSIAGVGASAMLGLLAALNRHDMALAMRALDAHIATTLRPFSVAYRREESFVLMQRQVELFPEVVNSMQSVAQGLERHAYSLNEQLLASQSRLHSDADARYAGLAESMASALKASLIEAASTVNDATQCAVEQTLAGLARETRDVHASLTDAVEQQLQAAFRQHEVSAGAVSAAWQSAVAEQRAANASLQADMQALLGHLMQGLDHGNNRLLDELAHRIESGANVVEQTWADAIARHEQSWLRSSGDFLQTSAAHDRERLQAWTDKLEEAALALNSDSEAAQSRAAALQQVAGGLITEMRELLAGGVARDARMLDERDGVISTLNGLVATVHEHSDRQQASADALLARSTEALERVSLQLAESIETETGKLRHLAENVNVAGSGLASLGEAFRDAVHQFANSNDTLIQRLSGIEVALDQSMTRSDEQLAYYVAQAREVIDLSILSQKQIIEELQSLADQQAAAAVRA